MVLTRQATLDLAEKRRIAAIKAFAVFKREKLAASIAVLTPLERRAHDLAAPAIAAIPKNQPINGSHADQLKWQSERRLEIINKIRADLELELIPAPADPLKEIPTNARQALLQLQIIVKSGIFTAGSRAAAREAIQSFGQNNITESQLLGILSSIKGGQAPTRESIEQLAPPKIRPGQTNEVGFTYVNIFDNGNIISSGPISNTDLKRMRGLGMKIVTIKKADVIQIQTEVRMSEGQFVRTPGGKRQIFMDFNPLIPTGSQILQIAPVTPPVSRVLSQSFPLKDQIDLFLNNLISSLGLGTRRPTGSQLEARKEFRGLEIDVDLAARERVRAAKRSPSRDLLMTAVTRQNLSRNQINSILNQQRNSIFRPLFAEPFEVEFGFEDGSKQIFIFSQSELDLIKRELGPDNTLRVIRDIGQGPGPTDNPDVIPFEIAYPKQTRQLIKLGNIAVRQDDSITNLWGSIGSLWDASKKSFAFTTQVQTQLGTVDKRLSAQVVKLGQDVGSAGTGSFLTGLLGGAGIGSIVILLIVVFMFMRTR